ncbi:T9SS type A sorting domain-containing protein [Capnocytophaga sputigena]
MRNILFFMLVFFSIFLNAQSYNLKIHNYRFIEKTARVHCGTNNKVEIYVLFEDGTNDRIYYENPETKGKDILLDRNFYKKISKVRFYAFVHTKAITELTSDGCNGASAKINKYSEYLGICKKNAIITDVDNNGRAKLGVYLEIDVSPVIELSDSFDKNIGYKTPFVLKVEDNSSKFSKAYYCYQYQVVSTLGTYKEENWKEIPIQYQQKISPEINLETFLKDSDIGKYIYFRTKSSCGGKYTSTPRWFHIKKSLPILKNDNNDVIITNCYGDKANYTLRFDRPLKEGEKMFFNIKGVNVGNPDPFTYELDSLEKGNTLTFKNLKAGTYAVSYLGNGSANAYTPYTEVHPFIFTIKNPDPVRFLKVSTPNPSCNGTSDGQIVIGAFGGTENNYKIEINGVWHNFSSRVTHVFKNLREGIYTIRVKDGNGCIAKLRDTNRETITIELKAPDPITISYPPDRQKLPSFNGASDGYITAVIKGGTPFNRKEKYDFVWEDANDNALNTEPHYDPVTGEFSVILRSVREGDYFLSVYDQNYERDNDKRKNCAKLRSQYYLSQPEELKATIELSNPISCNSQNEFGDEKDKNPYDGQRDESQDGELKIEASGGTPFTGTQNGGKPYIYTWKKQDNNGNWVTLPIEDDTAKNLSAGKYAINIQDANGIVLGEYNTHTVTKVVDVVYELKEPAKLTLVLQKTDATCKGNDGKITATPTGGTPPYTYLWSNGATTASIENLLPMPYTVEIKDGAGCMVQGSTAVMQPNSLTVTGTITPLRCHNANNAAIALAVQGGTAPYQYLWNTGATTANINNLPSGEYKVKITDAQGCAHFKTFTIENPSKFEIDLGENRTLCNGQTLTLNIAINDPQATYLWTGDNGFSSNTPQVTLSEKGTYTTTVTTKDGCTATDAITIESANTQIASEFLLTTQAYENEEVILVNTSSPKGETTEWLVPENQAIEVTNKSDDYISLIFKAKGEYRIGIKQTQANCFELFYKNIIVEPATDLPKTQKNNEAFVREFEVAPNPNDGKFKAKVVLEKAGAIKFRLYSITGQLVSEKNSASATEHWVDFQDPLPAATYILVLETPYQRLSKKIIIIP